VPHAAPLPEDPRAGAVEAWLHRVLATLDETLADTPVPLAGDAGRRRYRRLHTDRGPRLLVDAPPETENSLAWLAVGAWLRRHGLGAPAVLAADPAAGHLLVEDLGETTLARAVADAPPARVDALYRRVLDALVDLQRAGLEDPPALPVYDRERLREETHRFRRWFAEGLLDLPVPGPLFDALVEDLAEASLAAPRVVTHLDWHSRNLLLGEDDRIGIVDFQDARSGPAAYDVVSLLRDCYLRWSEGDEARWLAHYLARARAAGIPGTADEAAFRRCYGLCGIQRHLKALGIFARLQLQEGRSTHLRDAPRVLDHLSAALPAFPETRAFGSWFEATVRPAFARRTAA
jgi:aminoglycoside/choline kinase family phosphotransferase